MKKNLTLGVFLTLWLISCERNTASPVDTEKTPVYHTWHSLKEMEYGAPASPIPLEIPAMDFHPWAGIASHHVLTHEYLDAWFSRLAEMRKPRRFYILSPSHYGISLETYSLTIGSWDSGFGFVESDREKVRELAGLLEVGLDPGVFDVEHGVSTFMPYIKKYFPEAKVIAIAYEGEAPVNVPIARRLAEVLENEFNEKGKMENFLLISADFSHRGNLKETNRNDYRAQQYLKMGRVSWNMLFCDNHPAFYILDRLGKNKLETHILYHANSWEISGYGEDDITSYFFVYFAEH